MIEAMKQALEALEALQLDNSAWKALADSNDSGWWLPEDKDQYKKTEQAITSLRQAIAEAEKGDDVYVMGNYAGKGKVSSVTLGGVSFTGNGTARREADVKPTGFFFQMPEAEKQEPVVWHTEVKNGKLFFHVGVQSFPIDYTGTKEEIAWMENQLQHALSKLISPPQRQWVGLTDEEIQHCLSQSQMDSPVVRLPIGWRQFSKAIETKLKEKNT